MSGNTSNNDANGYSFGNPPPMGNPAIGAMMGTPAAPPQREPMRKYRGDSLLQPHRMRERMRNKEIMLGFGMGLGSPDIARCVAGAGYDFIFVDWEHSPMSIREVTELIRWITLTSEGNTAVVVRVPTHEHNWIAWALDAGASAIVLPHTESAEQAKKAVDAARFYTDGGHRSYPPFSMFLGFNDGDHKENALPWQLYNRSAVICQVESAEGAKHADEICQVEGVDALMVGHMDLRFDMNLNYGGPMDEPEYLSAVGTILAAAKKHRDIPVLTFADGSAAQTKHLKAGFRMLMVGADGTSLCKGLRNTLVEANDIVDAFEGKPARKQA